MNGIASSAKSAWSATGRPYPLLAQLLPRRSGSGADGTGVTRRATAHREVPPTPRDRRPESRPMRGIRLTDGEVELRAPRRTDAAELHAAVRESLPELLPWMAWAHPAYSEIEAAEWVRRAARAFSDGVEFQFVARSLASGALLGTIGLNTIDRLNRWANLGYWIRSSRVGNGYVTRSARLVTGFGFAE